MYSRCLPRIDEGKSRASPAKSRRRAACPSCNEEWPIQGGAKSRSSAHLFPIWIAASIKQTPGFQLIRDTPVSLKSMQRGGPLIIQNYRKGHSNSASGGGAAWFLSILLVLPIKNHLDGLVSSASLDVACRIPPRSWSLRGDNPIPKGWLGPCAKDEDYRWSMPTMYTCGVLPLQVTRYQTMWVELREKISSKPQ